MKQTDNQKLFNYWLNLKGNRLAPHRSEIDPYEIRDILPSTFILSLNSDRSCHYRLAGSQVCSIYGKELKGSSYFDYWEKEQAKVLASFIERIKKHPDPGVVEFSGTNNRNNTLNVETLLLPLFQEGDRISRIIGCSSLIELPFWLGSYPVISQELKNLKNIPLDQNEAAPELAVKTYETDSRMDQDDLLTRFSGRRYGSLVVIDGALQT